MASNLSSHVFQWDGITDERAIRPVECCATCGLPKRHERHEVPETPAEVTAHEQRILGETEWEAP